MSELQQGRKSTTSLMRNSDVGGGGVTERLRLVDDRDGTNILRKHMGGGGGGGDSSSRYARENFKKQDTVTTSSYQLKSLGGTHDGGGGEFRQHCAKNFSRSKMKTIKLTLTVIVMYIICSTPYFVGMLMNLLLDPSKLGIAISECDFISMIFK